MASLTPSSASGGEAMPASSVKLQSSVQSRVVSTISSLDGPGGRQRGEGNDDDRDDDGDNTDSSDDSMDDLWNTDGQMTTAQITAALTEEKRRKKVQHTGLHSYVQSIYRWRRSPSPAKQYMRKVPPPPYVRIYGFVTRNLTPEVDV